ncbi:MAG: phosphohistidine phosphatase SixA [Endozoicomonas sp.]
MKLIIMRHGQAGWNAVSDAQRPLTQYGQKEVSLTAGKLKGLGVNRVLASPYLRAQQTGEIVAAVLGCDMETLECITPNGSPLEAVNALPESGTVLLASHMPLVSAMTGLLCDGNERSGPGFATANAAVLEMEIPGIGLATLLEVVGP